MSEQADRENAFALFEMEREGRDTQPVITPIHSSMQECVHGVGWGPCPQCQPGCDEPGERTNPFTTPNPTLGIDREALEQARRELELERMERAIEWRRLKAEVMQLRGALHTAIHTHQTTPHKVHVAAVNLLLMLDELERMEGGV